MIKNKTKYAWEGWTSSGNEPCVFSVAHPSELIGAHAKLIDGILRSSEKIEKCLYAPRATSTQAPFSFKHENASYGLCVTDQRFIISKDTHTKAETPTVILIDFDDILFFHIGKALLLGWFSIGYHKDGHVIQENILYSSIGQHHFEKAVRSCKKHWNACLGADLGQIPFAPASLMHKAEDKIHAQHLKTLMSSGEQCQLIFSCQYLWEEKEKKRQLFRLAKPRNFLSGATCVLTDKTLLLARNSLGGNLDRGVDVLVLPLEHIQAIKFVEERLDTKEVWRLKVYFKKMSDQEKIEIPLVLERERIELFIQIILAHISH